MSNSINDIVGSYDLNYGALQKAKEAQTGYSREVRSDSSESNNTLSFEDMLLLMVTQQQNQTIDNQADTNDMMNQIISMTVMQAITEMSTQVQDLTEANIQSYTASLVGKEVTMAIVNNKGEVTGEKVGVVTATGTYNGQRVVYIGDEMFPITHILAVGRLPKKPEDTEKPGEGENPGDVENPGGVENPDGPKDPDASEGPENPDAPQNPDAPENTENPGGNNDNTTDGTDAASQAVPKALG